LLLKFCVWFLPLNFLPSFLPSLLVLLKAPLPTLQIFFLFFPPPQTHTHALFCSTLFCSSKNEWMNEMGSLAFLPPLRQFHFLCGFWFFFFFFWLLLGEYWVLFEGF
jgi:hypothetical protein